MRITKAQLLNVISEQEVDEFAEIPKGTQNTENKIPKFRPFWFPENFGKTNIPDGWWINPNKVAGEEKLFLFLDGQQQEDFEEQNGDFLDDLQQRTGKDFELIDRKKVKEHPRNKMVGTTYVPSGKKKPEATKIKIELNRAVQEVLCSPQVIARLDKLSIPEIKSRSKKHINRWADVSNQHIEYATHSYDGYLDSAQFLDFVTARVTGQPLPDQLLSYHLARQFNKIYGHWDDTTKHHKEYHGKTEAYKLDKFGQNESNLDVCVRADLKISGYLQNDNTFKWTVNFQTKFGRKLTEARWMGGLSPNVEKTFYKTAVIPDEAVIDETHTILDVFTVKNALMEVLEDLKRYFFKEVKPVAALNQAKFNQSQVVGK